ncbi:MAG TPA: OmpH family outer membrane protein [Bacteroidales bacterium]|nr:OmpH family outer membrane protein [Bacteroidales bacterium]
MQEEQLENPGEVREENVFIAPVSEDTREKKRAPFFVFNSNTVLALILLAGLCLLYVTRNAGSREGGTAIPVQATHGKQLSVVFVNTDTINAHYEFVKALRSQLEGTGKKLQEEVLSEQSRLEKEAADFQRQVAANQISEDKAKQVYEELMQKQQDLMQKKEHYTNVVAEQEMNMNLRLIDSVTAFLKRFNRQYRFDYILGYKTGGEILVSNDTLDITAPVLEALNKEFQQRKK